MEKIAETTDILAAEAKESKLQNEGIAEVVPLIITVDPLRDSVSFNFLKQLIFYKVIAHFGPEN